MHALSDKSRKLAVQDTVSKANDYVGVVRREVIPVKVDDKGASAGGSSSHLLLRHLDLTGEEAEVYLFRMEFLSLHRKWC